MGRLRLAAALCSLLCLGLSCAHAVGARPTLDELRNATISGIESVPVTMKDGVYEGPAYQPGGASRLRVTLWTDLVAFGDLQGKAGEVAAAVLLSATSGGSGSVVYVATFQARAGGLVNVGTAPVGDRTQVRAVTIADGAVIIDVVEAGPSDAMCCPSQLARKSYAVRAGRLTLVSSVVTGTLSLAVLAVPRWTLARFDEQPLPDGARPPMIAFDVTRVSGFGGCNHYAGPVEERTPGAIAVGPLAATKMACPPPAMDVEARYLAALAVVSRYTFVGGRLLLSGMDGATSRRLTFDRSGP